MVEWITNFVASGGYLAIAFLMFLENVFPPIPSELIMPLGGFVAGQGKLSFWGVWLAGTVGSVAGQLPIYYLGYAFGLDRIKGWADRWGKWLALSGKDLQKAVDWFERHGKLAVLLGRLVPGVRTLVSLPAGLYGMNLPLFLLYSTLGMGAWALLLTAAGWLLGENYERVEHYVGPVAYVVFGAIAVALTVFIVRRKLAQRRETSADDDAEPATE